MPAEPVVTGKTVYWGSESGNEQATSLTGKPVWSTFIGQTHASPVCHKVGLGVSSSATVASVSHGGKSRKLVFVGGGDSAVYALDGRTGLIVWRRRLGALGSAFVWGSPLVHDGSVYIGVASVGDCPLVRGALFKLSAATGTIRHVLYTVPAGCTGAGIWSSPALDAARKTIFFTTGNPGHCWRREQLAQAFVEVKASNLAVLASWSIPRRQQVYDSDFGATPTLFRATIRRSKDLLVGAVNKNGIYYALRRRHLKKGPVWTFRVGVGGSNPGEGRGDIAPSAWNRFHLFVAGGHAFIGGRYCLGTLNALNPGTGRPIWRDCLPGPVLGAPVVAPGIVEVGAGRDVVVAQASNGAILYQDDTSGRFQGTASISNGSLYQGNNNGALYAFGLAPGS